MGDHLHDGTAATLAAVPKASCSDTDYAFIWLNSRVVKMVYDASATNATDINDPPTTIYYQRPDDYGAGPGVWKEDVGAEESIRLPMNAIRTGELIIDDDGSIHSANKTSYSDTDGGFYIGYDTDDWKVNVGNSNSFFKWSGSAMAIKMASGETFDLYGSMVIYGGGDITLKGSDTDPGTIYFDGTSYDTALGADATGAVFEIAPDTDDAVYFFIGATGYGPYSSAVFKQVAIGARETITLNAGADDDSGDRSYVYLQDFGITFHVNQEPGNHAFDIIFSNDGSDGGSLYPGVGVLSDATGIDLGEAANPWRSLYLLEDIYLSDGSWIGLGSSAGRIEFDDQSTDEINFLDCVVGIGTNTPSMTLHTLIDSDDPDIALFEQSRAAKNAIVNIRAPAGQSTNLYFQEGSSDKAGIRWNGSDDQLEILVGNISTEAMRIEDDGDTCIGGMAPSARLHIYQGATDGAKPVLLLDQQDVSEEFIKFIGSAANGVLTQSLVDEGDQAGETREGWLRIYIQDDGNQIPDGYYMIPFYSLSP